MSLTDDRRPHPVALPARTRRQGLNSEASGRPITTGMSAPEGLAFDASGDLWISDYYDGTVTEFLAGTLTGTPQTGTTISVGRPGKIVFDPPPYDLPVSR